MVRSGVENLWKVGARFPTVALWIALLASSLGAAQPSQGRTARRLAAPPPPAPNSGVTAQDRRSGKGAVYTCGALLWAVTPGCTPCWGLGQQRSGIKSHQQTPQQGCSAGNFPPWAICSCPSGQGRALARARTHTHAATTTTTKTPARTHAHHHQQNPLPSWKSGPGSGEGGGASAGSAS